ncbi:glycosyltransferase family protein [Halanaeroarchaeum sulfurireducens]|nr:glycosyltransferase family 2 protein [Halanaeroarchaeum sulfurireducens]
MTTKTPVALFIYKRPKHTEKVLKQIRKANPQLLLVIADGPRNESEHRKCKETRRLVEEVEYDFEVRTNFASKNLGLRKRFESGLEWIFEQTEEAIILEDDTFPHPSFFTFCENLLEYYRDDRRVWDISGSNHLGKWQRNGYDYHFSHYGGIWGWATWRDSWKEYNSEMDLWKSDIVKDRIRDVIANDKHYQYTNRVYDETRAGVIETWDYQWGFSRHRNNGLSVVPSKNLVRNIGFDETATHTTDSTPEFAEDDIFELSLPLSHPPFVAPDRGYDQRFHNLRNTRSVPRRIFDAINDKISR